MVSSLPNEIILDILELAANASPASALTLCLLSSTTARSIRPILYKKVVLLHDTQVPSFAWTLVPAAHRALQLHAHAHALGPVHQPEHRVLHGHGAGRDDVREPGGAGVLGRLAVGPAVPEPRPEKRIGWIHTSQVSALVRRGCALGRADDLDLSAYNSSTPRRTIQRRHEDIPI